MTHRSFLYTLVERGRFGLANLPETRTGTAMTSQSSSLLRREIREECGNLNPLSALAAVPPLLAINPHKGVPQLANTVSQDLEAANAVKHERGGIDHGTWIRLTHLFAEADVPVLQVSLPTTLGRKGLFSWINDWHHFETRNPGPSVLV